MLVITRDAIQAAMMVRLFDILNANPSRNVHARGEFASRSSPTYEVCDDQAFSRTRVIGCECAVRASATFRQPAGTARLFA